MNPKGIPSNYVQNEQGEWCHPSRVGRLLPTEPKQDAVPALDQITEAYRGVTKGVVLRVEFIRRSQKRLDTDNLAFAFKAMRDSVAWTLGVDDNDPRIIWNYEQITGKPYGTIVLFHLP